MMKEVCVAILDTGIEYNNLLKNNVIEGFGFNNGIKTDDYNDENGHGTKCANIIRMYCDDKVKFIIAKVLNENMEGYEKDILFALNYLKDFDIDIIHMSLDMKRCNYLERLNELVDYYKNRKVIIISSQYNKSEEICYPAHLKGVIGVRGIECINERSFYYFENRSLNIECSNLPILVRSLKNKIEMFGGNSKAAAAFTGLVCNYMKSYDNLAIEEILERFSDDKKHNSDLASCQKRYSKEELNRYIKYIKKIVVTLLRKKEIDEYTNLYEIGLNNTNIDILLRKIGKQYEISNYEEVFSYYDLMNIYNISECIYRNQRGDKL